MTQPIERIVIVGGGPTAVRCAFTLRDRGYAGRISVIAEEAIAPYDRTLVSKDLLDQKPPRRSETLLADPATYDAYDIRLRLGCQATGLDWRARRVLLRTGKEEPYDRLIIATGGRARGQAPWEAAGALTLRTWTDASRLVDALDGGGALAIIGAGFVGAEVASAARVRGIEVTMIEPSAVPYLRTLGHQVGTRLAALHQANGVHLVASGRVESMTRSGATIAIRLAGGRRIRATNVLAAIGMQPATEWLANAGVTVGGRVRTDQYCETGIPGVLAAGDAAAWFDPRSRCHVAFEHWDTAQRHGEAVAANALGGRVSFSPVPFFWSDQHGTKLQMVGDPTGHDEVRIDELDPPRAFVARYFLNGRHLATFAANHPRAIASARRGFEAAQALGAAV